ncbi:hypothetical protein CRENBAI_000192 [Crenichthys baileyi]|uniref:Uncharacterized protein n=1 Tax=Crenichthys baileyi TaxID=28760 RepID=A0AAV9SRJ4_9TELE
MALERTVEGTDRVRVWYHLDCSLSGSSEPKAKGGTVILQPLDADRQDTNTLPAEGLGPRAQPPVLQESQGFGFIGQTVSPPVSLFPRRAGADPESSRHSAEMVCSPLGSVTGSAAAAEPYPPPSPGAIFTRLLKCRS